MPENEIDTLPDYDGNSEGFPKYEPTKGIGSSSGVIFIRIYKLFSNFFIRYIFLITLSRQLANVSSTVMRYSNKDKNWLHCTAKVRLANGNEENATKFIL